MGWGRRQKLVRRKVGEFLKSSFEGFRFDSSSAKKLLRFSKKLRSSSHNGGGEWRYEIQGMEG